MAWNRSSAESAPVKKKGGGAPSSAKGILIGLAIAVPLVALCLWMFSGSDDAPKAKADKDRGLIKEVTPARAKKADALPEVKKDAAKVAVEQPAVSNVEEVAVAKPKPRRNVKTTTNRIHRVKAPYAIFKHRYQNELAAYMTVAPGTMMVGRPHYTSKFVKEVVETMSLPIEDEPTDTPEQRALRQEMRTVMKSLQAEVDAGRDVREIFTQTREELQKLGEYRQEIENEVKKSYRDKEISDQDVEDIIDAANIMLEKKGIAPLKFGKMAKEIIKNNRDLGLTSRHDKGEPTQAAPESATTE